MPNDVLKQTFYVVEKMAIHTLIYFNFILVDIQRFIESIIHTLTTFSFGKYGLATYL